MVDEQRAAAGVPVLRTDAELVRLAGAVSRGRAVPPPRCTEDSRPDPRNRWDWDRDRDHRPRGSGDQPRFAGIGGANLAIGQDTPAAVLQLWMRSPQHRANILDPHWTRVGVAVYIDAAGVPHWTLLLGYPVY
ncbi:CAP domain-containing protein [Streptodolium elevatio]